MGSFWKKLVPKLREFSHFGLEFSHFHLKLKAITAFIFSRFLSFLSIISPKSGILGYNSPNYARNLLKLPNFREFQGFFIDVASMGIPWISWKLERN